MIQLFFHSRESRSQSLGSGSNSVGLTFVNGQATIGTSGISADTALYNSDIFSCVNLISSDVASAQFRIRHGDDPHLINLLQRKPNGLTNAFSFWQGVTANLLLNGNSYVLIYRDKHSGIPVKLEFVDNDEVEVKMSDDGQSLWYVVTFQDSSRRQITLASSEVLHFRLLSKDGGLMGISPLLSLRQEVQLQSNSNKLTLTSMGKSLNPSGILKVSQGLLDKKAKDNIRSEYEKANSGDNAGRVMILDSTMTFDPKSIDADVLKVLQQVDWTRQQISKAFSVPLNYLNQESEHSNQDQIRGLYSTCLNRYTNAITSEITTKLCKPNQEAFLDISNVVDPDYSALEKRVADGVKAGLYTPEMGQDILKQAKGA